MGLLDYIFGPRPLTRDEIRALVQIELKPIIMTQAEAAAQLKAVRAQQDKSVGEIDALQTESTAQLERIKALEALINAGGDVSPELATALKDVVDGQQAVDDKIPDAPTPVPVPEA
jgi:hypothetical protein